MNVSSGTVRHDRGKPPEHMTRKRDMVKHKRRHSAILLLTGAALQAASVVLAQPPVPAAAPAAGGMPDMMALQQKTGVKIGRAHV